MPDHLQIVFESKDGIFCRVNKGKDYVPDQLKVERTHKQQYQESGRTHLIRSLDSKPYKFMTGLDCYDSENRIYYGNHLKADGKRSFCLFQFSDKYEGLTLYYFNSYMVFPKYRAKFIRQFLSSVK